MAPQASQTDTSAASAPSAMPSQAPPSYAEQAPSADPDDLLGPMTLVLSGHFIHPDVPDPPHAYSLNRGVALLSHATSSVEFSRMEHSVRTAADNTPSVAKPRTRHIFDLHHDPRAGRGSPEYWMTPVSRHVRAVGEVGLEKGLKRFGLKVLGTKRTRFRALRIARGRGEFGQLLFGKGSGQEVIFEAVLDEKGERLEWTDAEGKEVAIEETTSEGSHRLVLQTAVRRDVLDGLVALWCLRIWHDSADSQTVHEGMEGVRRKFKLAEELPRTRGF